MVFFGVIGIQNESMGEAMSELVQFVVIGVAKCGTTSLHEYLRQHPSISLPQRKETHFFIYNKASGGFPEVYNGREIKEYIDTEEDYLAEFEKKPTATIFGEVCPSYFYYPNAAENIHRYCPNAKILCILRNPIYRLYSEYTYAQLRKDGGGDKFTDESQSFRAVVQQIMDGTEDVLTRRRVETGFYTRYLTRYYHLFPKEQIKILLFDDLRFRPDELMNEITEFIGAKKFTYDVQMRFNSSGKARFFSMYSLLRKTGLKKFLRNKLSAKAYQNLRFAAEKYLLKAPPQIDPESRSMLQSIYENEILDLQELISKDLSSWLV